jgi:hypothetical protein
MSAITTEFFRFRLKNPRADVNHHRLKSPACGTMKLIALAIIMFALGAVGGRGAAFGQASTQIWKVGQPHGAGPLPDGVVFARAGRGNPLWAIPVASLHETRDRPLFSASRRPDAPIVAEAPMVSIPQPSAPPPQEKPQFTLVGMVHGPRLDLAVLIDETRKSVLRLRVGESAREWTLRSLANRTVTLAKAQQQVTLQLPPRNAGVSAATLTPAQITAAAVALDE